MKKLLFSLFFFIVLSLIVFFLFIYPNRITVENVVYDDVDFFNLNIDISSVNKAQLSRSGVEKIFILENDSIKELSNEITNLNLIEFADTERDTFVSYSLIMFDNDERVLGIEIHSNTGITFYDYFQDNPIVSNYFLKELSILQYLYNLFEK